MTTDRAHVYYWKNYFTDRSRWNDNPINKLNQSSRQMIQIRRGDLVWAITRSGRGHYVVAGRFNVQDVGENPPGSPDAGIGAYYFRSGREGAVYFKIEHQQNAEAVIRQLCRAKAAKVGQSFQGRNGVRGMSEGGAVLIDRWSATSLEPEAKWTAPVALSAWTQRVVALVEAMPGVRDEPPERREMIVERFNRNSKNVQRLRGLYGGICQVTGRRVWSDNFEPDLTEAHHIVWLSKDGPDDISNMMMVSPDVHAAIHATGGTLRWENGEPILFLGDERLPLRVNKHLADPASYNANC